MITTPPHITCHEPTAETPLELAKRFYREYYTSCFWHCRPDLPITEDKIPLVVKGLLKHGGKNGLQAAAQLTARKVGIGTCR